MEIDKRMKPQEFLDIIEKVICKKGLVNRYLVEYDKPTVTSGEKGIEIRVEDIAATSVRALRWDYLIGEDLIHNRQFIITGKNAGYARYFIDLSKHSDSIFTLKLSEFRDDKIAPYMIYMHDLEKSKLKIKLELKMDYSYGGKIEVVKNTSKGDTFSSEVLEEILK